MFVFRVPRISSVFILLITSATLVVLNIVDCLITDDYWIYLCIINCSSECLCISDFHLDISLIATVLHKFSLQTHNFELFPQTYNLHILPMSVKADSIVQVAQTRKADPFSFPLHIRSFSNYYQLSFKCIQNWITSYESHCCHHDPSFRDP